MDSIEPEQTPFAALTAHTSRFQRVCDFFEEMTLHQLYIHHIPE
jgi:hypothetical protein